MKIDHIHFYVENATQTRDWLIEKMSFQSLGQNIELDTLTELLGNAHLVFLVSAALTPDSPVAHYLKDHPPGVADIAFLVPDLELMLAKSLNLGINIVQIKTSSIGNLQSVTIQGWGDYHHTLVTDSTPTLVPATLAPDTLPNPLGILGIDHVVLNVHQGQMASAVSWYERVFGFQVQQAFTIQTHHSGLYSKALIDPTEQVQFNINESSTTNSQIQTFLDHNRGTGIQHIALLTQHIYQTITHLRDKSLSFLPISKDYYYSLKKRSQRVVNFAFTAQEWQTLEALEILLDWSDNQPESLLMQIFTQPIFEQPTFFFEFIERRRQMKGFGEGNFFALFQAMETRLT